MMRLILVNRCHPLKSHVCAVRARGFAHGLAGLGHQIVLVTQTLDDQESSATLADLPAAMAAHDWSQPFILACAPTAMPWLVAARNGRLPKLARKIILGASYFLRSGVYSEWSRATRPYWPLLARHFNPQAVWGTFGDTDAVLIAQGIARQARCPWVFDMKDPWRVFIPFPFRRLLAKRFADASAFSTLSQAHGAEIDHWFDRGNTVVYSGIDRSLLPPMPEAPRLRSPKLVLIGSLYRQEHLDQILQGVAQWAETLDPDARTQASLVYAGAEIETLRRQTGSFPIRVETPGWVDFAGLRHLAADATALLYVRSIAALFQQKGLELAALDRPILCLPREGEETTVQLSELGARFFSCSDASAVAQSLHDIHERPVPGGCDRRALAAYSQDSLSVRMEALFQHLLSNRR